ncbi:MAG TPA: FAD-dependent 5-carboxymethylaminomethyl-2-thiouridine(34) oxidoreductase MnmC [Ramlibacter sp.]|uniref:FAD-dependent 5-carboxymethylaminomethyl-2-thiouridine(34) oxidoreductase MnmC n=1 Tax=Ramlibacter sp. TaxID=1917967 RepID=UPI002CDFD613|nr:FAD-dependent 5-carboxymethylaminomethyl-2-thiouridine(34) oxidoreductase MnmC [Ramlibacter sp.]HVZ43734.1 FAD-dependent 5-carboxymethylaminomethyl-2-thiouridine(34) oxidoreductase MnmC [Ramlibacter sp.]
MATVEWGADGTPRSPRFDDIYRPAGHGLGQARHVFLGGCGLPHAWAAAPAWTILETGFGLGLNFLAAWRAWLDDTKRPRMLHFVSVEAWPVSAEDLLRSAADHDGLPPLARQLAAQWFGLLAGVHRFSFEHGRVLLTLAVGDVHDVLGRLAPFHADAVFLDGFEPQRNPAMWDAKVMKALARHARRGARVATWTVAGDVRRALAEAGFQVEKRDGLPPKRHCLHGTYDPPWQPKGSIKPVPVRPGRCAVIGGGLSGAAVAAALAQRGWSVAVHDAAAQPAAGASALPAGLMAPHQSPDDNLLSRLTRAGIRHTLQEAARLLGEGEDWARCGALELRIDDSRAPPHSDEAAAIWSRPAPAALKSEALLDASANAWWHEAAAWIRPAALVRAWLGEPGIEWRGGVGVQAIRRQDDVWWLDDTGPFDCVVVAAAHASAALLSGRLALHPVRGQVSWSDAEAPGLPPFPLNGNGHFLPRVPIGGKLAWLTGSTYGRGENDCSERQADHAANLQRLRVLAPRIAESLAPRFERGEVRAWAGVRCTSTDRRPLVGRIEEGLWVSTAMGSRGLTFASLCAQLLAARLHGEPLPLERKLADALDLARNPHPNPLPQAGEGASAATRPRGAL